MKKIFAVGLALLALCVLPGAVALAEEPALSAEVYVTVADGSGRLAMAHQEVQVTDADGDGALTVNDALYAAHEDAYDGGAAAGYASEVGEYGLYITKLWGEENGGSYGYYLNHAPCWSLTDPVAEGDNLTAFVYTDLESWSDTYCYFDRDEAEMTAGEPLTLTLMMAGYDENYNPVALPVAGATITLNGEKTDLVTDENGQVTLTGDETFFGLISAVSDELTLVPPVCQVSSEATATVPDEVAETTTALFAGAQAEIGTSEAAAEATAPETTAPAAATGETGSPWALALTGVGALAAVALLTRRHDHDAVHEK